MQSQESQPKYAKLNIGGSLFYTTIGTLTKHDTMLKAMFSGRMKVLTDTEGMPLVLYKYLVYLINHVLIIFSCIIKMFRLGLN